MRLPLVRHGFPALDPTRPASEWGLDPRGIEGVEAMRDRGVLPPRACWVSSPERKARETALLLTTDPVHEDPALVEARRGASWIGEPAAFEAVVRASFADPPTPAAPGWEPLAVTATRVIAAVESWLARTTEPALVLVGHGTAWSIAVAHLTGTPPDLDAWSRLRMPDHCSLDLERRVIDQRWGAW